MPAARRANRPPGRTPLNNSRLAQLENALRDARRHCFDDGADPERIPRIKRAMMRARRAHERHNPAQVGAFSGLTRAELTQTRTCEPDWF